jgi:PiT family inorganic phosphate transporter
MAQVGPLAFLTEFFGAVALGERVTDTIKNGIITIDRFQGNPGTLMLAMGCAEVGSASWLTFATFMGMPVSTTQTIVGALVGVGFASQSEIKWNWEKGSVSQVAASWGIAPLIAAAFSSCIFGLVKYTVLERKNSFEWAMRLIPFYFALTAGILALFITVEAPGSDIDALGAGRAVGIILGVFFGALAFCYIFFVPFFKRKLIRKDTRLRAWHIPYGPLLNNDNITLIWPGKRDHYVKNYYADRTGEVRAGGAGHARNWAEEDQSVSSGNDQIVTEKRDPTTAVDASPDLKAQDHDQEAGLTSREIEQASGKSKYVHPYDRWIVPVKPLSWVNPKKWWNWSKFLFLRGVTIDVISHEGEHIKDVHARANRYDLRTEHLFTYCQVASAMLMSIAHGSNDIANALGPIAASYSTYLTGEVNTEADTPVWLIVIGGAMLGTGFWFYGYHIMRAMGNKITQMSPSRGYAIELGAAITVLLASRLALPVSTTQCLTGAAIGVALMNYDLKAVNWRQVGFIFSSWILTLPSAGLIAGLMCVMALNTPRF